MTGETEITAVEVLAFLKQFEEASSTRSFARVVDLIHPDALFRFNDGDYRGLEAIQGAFERTWAYDVSDEHYRLSNIEVLHCNAGSAVASFNFTWSGVTADGPFEIAGRGTSVLVRHEGRLKVLVEHLSR